MLSAFNKIPADLRDISTLIVGNGFALFVPVLISPVISRLYEASHFGAFTIYITTVGLLSSFATGRYDHAILAARNRPNAQHLYRIALLIALTASVIFLLLSFVFKDAILDFINVPQLGKLLHLIPVNMLLFAVILACQNALNREMDYKSISAGKTIRSVFVGIVQVLFGFAGFLNGGLILGKLTGDIFSTAYLSAKLNRIGEYFSIKFSVKRAKYLLQKYNRFPKINAPHALLNSLSLAIIPFILGIYFGEDVVGFYGLSYMVCVVPVQLIGNAFYQVFSQKISVMFNDETEIRSYAKKSIFRLFALALIPFAVLTIFGPQIFAFIFGDEWLISGQYIQILAPFLFLVFLISPLVYIPLIYNEHAGSLYFEITLFISRVTALVFGAYSGDAFTAILYYSIASILVESARLWWILHLTKKHRPDS